jgi:hypothetical protein
MLSESGHTCPDYEGGVAAPCVLTVAGRGQVLCVYVREGPAPFCSLLIIGQQDTRVPHRSVWERQQEAWQCDILVVTGMIVAQLETTWVQTQPRHLPQLRRW